MLDFFAGLDYGFIFGQLTTNAVILSIGGWLAKLWADKRFEAIKGAQAIQLEVTKGKMEQLGAQLNAGIEKRKLVFETHFNLEFKSCQDIWSLCDEAHVIAARSLTLIQLHPVDDDAWDTGKVEAIERYDRCLEIFTSVRRLRPFISKDVADDAKELAFCCLNTAKKYKDVYICDMKTRTEEAFFDRKPYIKEMSTELAEIEGIYDRIADQISSRIESFYVVDFNSDADLSAS